MVNLVPETKKSQDTSCLSY